ncbi:PMT6 [Candida oxycetoniae]|uniref:Dolichyl-phosphate-mannose--protein mannosyltransferase n=1 Tax=Candida oxycetoniae TaxID=497107 RepID=A0AAI9T1P1_9ASCO|nr:PMT6 [Candida oxycetoniae]KAI3406661.2 PMT6 [Candida oxycetoniae]
MDKVFVSSISRSQSGSIRRRDVTGSSRVDIDEDSSATTVEGYTSDIDEIIEKTSKLKIENDNKQTISKLARIISPLILTALSAFVRIYRIETANKVIWDEAHFGKFASYYIKREYYFDVHPPLGKLLLGLSGYLAGYDGSFKFESGEEYPETMNFIFMRIFSCFFGILVTPIAYKTALEMGYNQWTCWLISLMVIFEQLSLTLSKFILLDSMLLFFTAFTFLCLMNLHNIIRTNSELSKNGFKWFTLTGLSIGCVCSVKWVGLFVTVLVGLYIIQDLLTKYFLLTSKRGISWSRYLSHWVLRVTTLIVIPVAVYMSAFKVHFLVLNHTGPGDGSISSLLQASLIGNDLQSGPRSVAFGSLVTIRSQGLSPNLLHSHSHDYPEGSKEQQVTTYGFKDDNNDFIIEYPKKNLDMNQQSEQFIQNADFIRLCHNKTKCCLRAHSIGAPMSKNHFEVSCSNDDSADQSNYDWILEIQSQEISPSPHFQNESKTELHPLSTNFRLKHRKLGCYLATTGRSYPSWGFQQGEVVCKNSIFDKDKNTWWNVEKHENRLLRLPTEPYSSPKPKFWKEFVLLNYGMMASNNALVPDPDKFDKISSEWWEWPILRTGLRMSGWGENDVKYFLMGNPFVTWSSTAAATVFVIPYTLYFMFRYKRQQMDSAKTKINDYVTKLLLPFAAWILHVLPFILMGRVKYLHHYVPALYFAILLSGFVFDKLLTNRKLPCIVSHISYLGLYFITVYAFWFLKDLALGMETSAKNFQHLRILGSWMI